MSDYDVSVTDMRSALKGLSTEYGNDTVRFVVDLLRDLLEFSRGDEPEITVRFLP